MTIVKLNNFFIFLLLPLSLSSPLFCFSFIPFSSSPFYLPPSFSRPSPNSLLLLFLLLCFLCLFLHAAMQRKWWIPMDGKQWCTVIRGWWPMLSGRWPPHKVRLSWGYLGRDSSRIESIPVRNRHSMWHRLLWRCGIYSLWIGSCSFYGYVDTGEDGCMELCLWWGMERTSIGLNPAGACRSVGSWKWKTTYEAA